MLSTFLRFNYSNKLAAIVLAFLISGCSVYERIDKKLYPTPQIQDEVDYQINRYSNGRVDVNFTISVTDGDMAMFYYSCRVDGSWDDEREVGSEQVIDGKAENVHVTMCDTKLLVQVIAYNNYMKRSQKQNGKAWLIDLSSLDLL